MRGTLIVPSLACLLFLLELLATGSATAQPSGTSVRRLHQAKPATAAPGGNNTSIVEAIKGAAKNASTAAEYGGANMTAGAILTSEAATGGGAKKAAPPPPPPPGKPGPPSATLILGAFRAAGLLNGTQKATIFAPSDDALMAVAKNLNLTSGGLLAMAAFAANQAANASAGATNVTQALVRNIVGLHIVPGPPLFYSANVTSTPVNVTSLQGTKLTLSRPGKQGGGVLEVRVAGNTTEKPAQVIEADIPANASLIHIINRVLLPPP